MAEAHRKAHVQPLKPWIGQDMEDVAHYFSVQPLKLTSIRDVRLSRASLDNELPGIAQLCDGSSTRKIFHIVVSSL